jgi:hypothetical protein
VRQNMREMDVNVKYRLIEENEKKRHSAPTPNKLGQGQEEKEDILNKLYLNKYINIPDLYPITNWKLYRLVHNQVY